MADFNPWFKNLLGWLPDSRVRTVIRNGIYRVYRFDTTTGTSPPGSLAFKIERDTFSNDWIGLRRKFTDIADMQSGAYVIWGHNTGVDSDLLDVSTLGSNMWDAALGLNQTLTDTLNGISIKSEASAPTYEDVQVTFRNLCACYHESSYRRRVGGCSVQLSNYCERWCHLIWC